MIRCFGFLAATVILALGGCAGLKQFPETSENYAADLPKLDKEYHIALGAVYATGTTALEQKRVRNEMIERRMAVIDVHFRNFEKSLARDNASTDFGVALVGVGVGAAGSLVAETTSQILSAVSGGLAGAYAAYGKAVLYDKALSALIAQMHASRKSIAAGIFERWDLGLEKYPLWVARRDLDAYLFAGSLPGAILATSADAKVKEEEADAILLGKVTSEAVTPEVIAGANKNLDEIHKLGDPQVIRLVPILENLFPNETRPFASTLDPGGVRFRDPDVARKYIKIVTPRVNRTKDGVEKLQGAIETVKQP